MAARPRKTSYGGNTVRTGKNAKKTIDEFRRDKYSLLAELRFVNADIDETKEILSDLENQKIDLENQLRKIDVLLNNPGSTEAGAEEASVKKRGRKKRFEAEAEIALKPESRKGRPKGKKRGPKKKKYTAPERTASYGTESRRGRVSKQETLGINLEEEVLDILGGTRSPLSIYDIGPHLMRRHKDVWSESYLAQILGRLFSRLREEGVIETRRDPEGGRTNFYVLSGSSKARHIKKVDLTEDLIREVLNDSGNRIGLSLQEIAESIKRNFPTWSMKRLKSEVEQLLETGVAVGTLGRHTDQMDAELKYSLGAKHP